ncbi:MAG: hypothetical protein JW910_22005, partial [Anaerolineae bacterium]|nr:hypothetical protein [Anaerolineae bacterium]
ADWVIARAARHDLERLADAALGFNERPVGWTYPETAALVRCSRSTQNLVSLLRANDDFVFTVSDPSQPSFCRSIEIEAGTFVENPPADTGNQGAILAGSPGEASEGSGIVIIETGEGIFGEATRPNIFLDHSARVEVGLMPRGTTFVALARSSAPDSSMMYVQGEGFNVWLSWEYTTLSEPQYLGLPFAHQIEDRLPPLLCMAWFCTQLITNGDPLNEGTVGVRGGQASLAQPGGNLQRLDYSQARFYFEADDPIAGWGEFRADLCGPAGCEPALRLWEFGQVVPPVRTVGGYAVWRLGYNFHGTARLESSSYYVEQLWLTHPYDR